MWIVMSSCAAMPSSCHGKYRNVAIVKLTPEYAEKNKLPLMISERARGVEKIIHLGHHNVGKTERGAFQRAVAAAKKMAEEYNQPVE